MMDDDSSSDEDNDVEEIKLDSKSGFSLPADVASGEEDNTVYLDENDQEEDDTIDLGKATINTRFIHFWMVSYIAHRAARYLVICAA